MSDLIIFYQEPDNLYMESGFYDRDLGVQFKRKEFETDEAYWDAVRMWHPNWYGDIKGE